MLENSATKGFDKLLIVESPAKAKTIKGYLDKSFEVVSSIGHFRDPPQKGIGIEEDENFTVNEWIVDNKKQTRF